MIYKRIILKLSGEALQGEKEYGIDPLVLKGIVDEITDVQSIGVQIGVVVGGGNIFRGLRYEEYGINRVVADYMGMIATLINSLALCQAIKAKGFKAKVISPIDIKGLTEAFSTELEDRIQREILIFACGTGNPFFTTDTAAVLRALEMKADVFIKGTKVDGVYSSDPIKDPYARFFEKVNYETFLKERFAVLDLTAVSLAMTYNLPIVVFNIKKKGNLRRLIEGEKIGTIIKGGE